MNGNKCLLLYFEEEKGSTVEVYVRVCVNEMDTSVQLGRESSFTYYYLFVSVCVCRSLLTHAGTHKKGLLARWPCLVFVKFIPPTILPHVFVHAVLTDLHSQST